MHSRVKVTEFEIRGAQNDMKELIELSIFCCNKNNLSSKLIYMNNGKTA